MMERLIAAICADRRVQTYAADGMSTIVPYILPAAKEVMHQKYGLGRLEMLAADQISVQGEATIDYEDMPIRYGSAFMGFSQSHPKGIHALVMEIDIDPDFEIDADQIGAVVAFSTGHIVGVYLASYTNRAKQYTYSFPIGDQMTKKSMQEDIGATYPTNIHGYNVDLFLNRVPSLAMFVQEKMIQVRDQ